MQQTPKTHKTLKQMQERNAANSLLKKKKVGWVLERRVKTYQFLYVFFKHWVAIFYNIIEYNNIK